MDCHHMGFNNVKLQNTHRKNQLSFKFDLKFVVRILGKGGNGMYVTKKLFQRYSSINQIIIVFNTSIVITLYLIQLNSLDCYSKNFLTDNTLIPYG
jgi:hypothetical protein